MDFLLSQEAQSLIATHGWIYPVDNNIPEAWLKAKNYLPPPPWISYSPEEIMDSKKIWIQEWVNGLIT
jgi:ABC-type thiamine transport system substrate-binding protein